MGGEKRKRMMKERKNWMCHLNSLDLSLYICEMGSEVLRGEGTAVKGGPQADFFIQIVISRALGDFLQP